MVVSGRYLDFVIVNKSIPHSDEGVWLCIVTLSLGDSVIFVSPYHSPPSRHAEPHRQGIGEGTDEAKEWRTRR